MKIEEAKKVVDKLSICGSKIGDIPLIKSHVVKELLDQIDLDQPKPVVPKCVAEWYEKHKEYLDGAIQELINNIIEREFISEIEKWFERAKNPIQTLVNMHQFGYEVEKEKLYTVEIPNPYDNQIALRLEKWVEGRVRIVTTHSTNDFTDDMYLTEQEIRKDFDWAWQQGFHKRVDL